MKFDDILSSPSLEAAAAKIDNMAKSKQLDSTLMLLMTKAWASAKESTLMKDEVTFLSYKCLSLNLYFVPYTKENFNLTSFVTFDRGCINVL